MDVAPDTRARLRLPLRSALRWGAVTLVTAASITSCGGSTSATHTTARSSAHVTAEPSHPHASARAAAAHRTQPATTNHVTTASPASSPWSVLTEPQAGLQPIYDLMSSARHELDITEYELADPKTVSILESAAQRGVTVRVLLDRDYSGASVNAADFAALEAHSVHVRWGPSDTIVHQKTITVDDHTTAIMTLNLTSQYYASTRDFAAITTDSADVAAVERVFNDDWAGDSPFQAGPTATNLVWSPGAQAPILALINAAHSSLLVENEEMADPAIVAALANAARRGVDVHVVMTYSSEWAPEFAELSAAGVHVGTYAADASLYIHAKVIVADHVTAFLGSQNFSDASLDYNRELGLISTQPSLVATIAATVNADVSGAQPFDVPDTSPARSTSSAPVESTAECSATAAPANDGYTGDYDVDVQSNQPDQKATASDANDTYSEYTNSSGATVIRLYYTSAGEAIAVAVGDAHCSTIA